MPSSPASELFHFEPSRRPRKRRVPADHLQRARRASLRSRVAAAVISFSLLALGIGVWLSPAVRRNTDTGPSPLELELASARARAEDLKAQLEASAARNRRPRPVLIDASDEARAEDLARQVDALERKLGIRRPPGTVDANKNRAEDLKRRLDEAEAKLKAPRPPGTTSDARADDLSRQLADAKGKLTRPRPEPGPYDGVVPHLTKAEIIAGRNLFGLYELSAPFNFGEVGRLEARVDRKANLIGYFQDWNDPFRADAIQASWKRHQIPLLTWEPAPSTGQSAADDAAFNLPSIVGGGHDDYIRSYARGIRSLAMPVVIRLGHEMNGDWYPWSEVKNKDYDNNGQFDDCGEWSGGAPGSPYNPQCSINGNTPGSYTTAWKRVHRIFAEEGANDYTIWLWAPNRVDNITPNANGDGDISQPDPGAFYPGDPYVDWIGMSGYLRPKDKDRTYSGTYSRTIAKLKSTSSKPILLAEIGATEQSSIGDGKTASYKVPWIDSHFDGIAADPDDRVIGFAWFSQRVSSSEEDKKGGPPTVTENNWAIDTTGASADALARGLAGGYGLPTG